MKIEHIAIWVKDLEKIRSFYEKYFKVTSTKLYHNQKTGFKSYFLTFDDGARLEIMSKSDINKEKQENTFGYAHFTLPQNRCQVSGRVVSVELSVNLRYTGVRQR